MSLMAGLVSGVQDGHTTFGEDRAGAKKTFPLLELDPALGTGLEGDARQKATTQLRAPLLVLERGEWDPPRLLEESRPLGLLVISGLIVRHVEVAGARCAELLGAGDLIRPWQEDAASFVSTRWQVLTRIQAALLTAGLSSRLCSYPPLVENLLERAIQRSRSLVVHSAIDNVVRLKDRLRLLFWHLAERWGKVERDGVIVPLPLTHQMLAELVGARRPSVSLALRELAEAGTLTKLAGRGWRLTGSPPVPAPLKPQRRTVVASASSPTPRGPRTSDR